MKQHVSGHGHRPSEDRAKLGKSPFAEAKAPKNVASPLSGKLHFDVALDAIRAPGSPDAIFLDREEFTNSAAISTLSVRNSSAEGEAPPTKGRPFSLRLPLVAPFAFECRSGGRLYELLGVRLFQKWMPTIDKFYKSPLSTEQRDSSENDRESRLRRFSNATTVFEACHIVTGFWLMKNALTEMQGGDITSALATTFINVLVNFYPVMSQRYNRARICNILDKQMQNNSGKRSADAPAS